MEVQVAGAPRAAGRAHTTRSVPGTLEIACSRLASASCSLRSAMVTSRGRVPRSATGPSGVNSSVSTPHGTTRDVAAYGHAEPGQVGLLVGAPGHHGASASADRGLEADALHPGIKRHHVVPALGDAEGVKRLHHGDPQVASGGKGGKSAGPAHRVHHVGALGAPPLVQRAAGTRAPA